MADHTAVQQFITHFLNPLVQGGPIKIGAPIDADLFQALLADIETTNDHFKDVDLTFQRRARLIFTAAHPVEFTPNALRLAVITHQLLCTLHAEAVRKRFSDKRIAALITDSATVLNTVPKPTTRADILAAHFVIDGLFRTYRKDTHLDFRVGSLDFYGEDISYVRWPWRRSPRTSDRGVDALLQLLDGPTEALTHELLRRSPLSCVRHAARLADAFSFADTLLVLRDPPLCRTLINTLVSEGIGPTMPAFAHGLKTLIRNGAPREDVLYASRFLITLVLTDHFWNPQQGIQRLLDSRYQPPERAVSFDDPDTNKSEGQRRKTLGNEAWALIAALLEQPAALALPPDDHTLVERFREEALQRMLPRLERERESMARLIQPLLT